MKAIFFLCFALVNCAGDSNKAKTIVAALIERNEALALNLLAAGADPNETNRYGDSPLIWATHCSYFEVAKQLLDKGSAVNHQGSYAKAALHWAAKKGDQPITELLLAKGARVNLVDEHLETPLIIAAAANEAALVILLLDQGATIDWTNKKGESALAKAIQNKSAATVEALILRGADIKQRLNSGQTLLELALDLGVRSLFLTRSILEKFPHMALQFEPLYQEFNVSQHAKPKLDHSQLSARIHQLVNDERTKRSFKPLDYDDKLEVIAKAHSKDMATRNFFAHINPDGENPRLRAIRNHYKTFQVRETSYKAGLGENIFKSKLYASTLTTFEGNNKVVTKQWSVLEDLAKSAVDGWMNSPGHRDNILLPAYERQAIGIFEGANEDIYITQNFF